MYSLCIPIQWKYTISNQNWPQILIIYACFKSQKWVLNFSSFSTNQNYCPNINRKTKFLVVWLLFFYIFHLSNGRPAVPSPDLLHYWRSGHDHDDIDDEKHYSHDDIEDESHNHHGDAFYEVHYEHIEVGDENRHKISQD